MLIVFKLIFLEIRSGHSMIYSLFRVYKCNVSIFMAPVGIIIFP